MIRLQTSSALLIGSFIAGLLVVSGLIGRAQTPSAPARGVIRLKVKYKSGQITKELGRKRFFLINGGFEQNQALIERIKQTNIGSRECFYRNKGASDALVNWLKENDCESVYCREIEEKYLSGAEAVPEFQVAYQRRLAEYKSPQLARRWLTVDLAPDLRAGFYEQKQQAVTALVTQAESATNAKVISVMTDRKGTAYLTDIDPGVYTITNLVGSETEKTSILWICEKDVKAVDLTIAMKRPFTLSNEADPKTKCQIIERPLPVCETAK